jgi:hypothetical protein
VPSEGGSEPNTNWREFVRRREGMEYALDGGLWLHRFRLYGRPMAHLVSSDREALLAWGDREGLDPGWLQYKPLNHPRTGERVPAWHWDLIGDRIPPPRAAPAEGG